MYVDLLLREFSETVTLKWYGCTKQGQKEWLGLQGESGPGRTDAEARRARSGDGSSYGGVGFRVFWRIQKSHYSPANFNDSAFILGMTVFA